MSLIYEHKLLKPFYGVNIRDKKLLQKYHLNDKTSFYRFVELFKNLGILTVIENNYSYKNKLARTYSIDIYTFMKIYEEVVEKDQILNPTSYSITIYESNTYNLITNNNLYKNIFNRDKNIKINDKLIYTNNKENNKKCEFLCTFNKDTVSSSLSPYNGTQKHAKTDIHMITTIRDYEWNEIYEYLDRNTIYTNAEVTESDFYKKNKYIFEKIEKCDANSMEIIWFYPKTDFSKKDIQMLKDFYLNKIYRENTISKECNDLINQLNKEGFNIRMNIHVKDTGKKRISIRPSCRQCNDLCYINKEKRKEYLNALGYDSEFDLHSAIFAITRYLNKGIFDVNWEIKEEIFEDWKEMKHNLPDGYSDELKEILNRAFFEQSIESAWWHYNDGSSLISKECFFKIFEEVRKLIGDTKEYHGNIFLYESLLELHVMKKALDKGIKLENVYDCFFYNSSEISEEEIKELITKSVECISYIA